jgi:hypothetical protein
MRSHLLIEKLHAVGYIVAVILSGILTAHAPVANAYLLVSSVLTDNVKRYDVGSGAFINNFITSGSGGLQGPLGLAYGPDGNLYVSSYSTNSVIRYNGTTGAFMNNFVSAGGGGLSGPRALTFGPDNNLYVSSLGTDSIKRYSGASGAFINDFVPAGGGGLEAPEGLRFGPHGNLYVWRVSVLLTSNGTTQSALLSPHCPVAGWMDQRM